MPTTIKISSKFHRILKREAKKKKVSVDNLCERWARLGQIIESTFSKKEIRKLLDGSAKIAVEKDPKKKSD